MNTEPEFTKGPWHITTPNGPRMGWSVGPAWLGSNAGTPEGEANAHLIAAAPDMYAALKDARAIAMRMAAKADIPYCAEFGEIAQILDAALAKAEGKA